MSVGQERVSSKGGPLLVRGRMGGRGQAQLCESRIKPASAPVISIMTIEQAQMDVYLARDDGGGMQERRVRAEK